jgi:hypothetical protein
LNDWLLAIKKLFVVKVLVTGFLQTLDMYGLHDGYSQMMQLCE